MGVGEPLYTREILRLAATAPAHGLIEGAEVVTARSPTCGSRISVTVETDGAGRVVAIGQVVEACAFGQASAALMALGARGRTFADAERALVDLTAWLAGERDQPGDWPGLDALAPARRRTGRHDAMLMPFRALVEALKGDAA